MKKKLFISQPMSGKREKEIIEDRKHILEHLAKFGIYEKDLDIIDTYVTEEPPEGSNVRLWFLGKTIEKLAQADLVVFAQDYKKARGCRVERLCAEVYHIPTVVLRGDEELEIEE